MLIDADSLFGYFERLNGRYWLFVTLNTAMTGTQSGKLHPKPGSVLFFWSTMAEQFWSTERIILGIGSGGWSLYGTYFSRTIMDTLSCSVVLVAVVVLVAAG